MHLWHMTDTMLDPTIETCVMKAGDMHKVDICHTCDMSLHMCHV